MKNGRAKAKTSARQQHRRHMKSVGSKLSQSNEDLLEAVKKKSPLTRRRDIENASVTSCETEPTEHQQVDTTRDKTAVPEKSSEAVEVLLKILLQQEELTLEEYTLNSQKFKVLVIEDTEF